MFIDILNLITGFIPRPIIMRLDEGGFRSFPNLLTGKCWITEMEPGNWYWVIPWFLRTGSL